MRPKLLEIEGLQSFRELQRIDFEALGETGLFGIFGPTGSGKSTVLDAITFALYGRVKRADGGTQGIINTNLNTAKVSFTFELIKDGVRKTFRVERTYQRKRGTVNSCEPKIARLIEITGAGEIPVCDKAAEVSNHIKELLGLSHEDFTRAVVLPQNSFQEFLLLNNSERRGMLERIFYLEEYGKQLQEKLNRKMAKLKSRMDILSGELKGYGDATGEALEEAQKELDTAVSERNRVEKELKLLEVKYNEAKEVWALVQELSLIHQQEQQHMASREAIGEKRVQLEKAVKAGGLMEMIRKNRELSEKLRETEKQLQEVLAALPGVIAGLNETRQRYEGLKSEAVIEQPKLVGLRTRLVDALGVRAEMQAIHEKIKGLQASAVRLKDEITKKSGAIRKETGELEALEQNFGRLKLEMEALKTDPEYRQQVQDGARLESEIGNLNGNVKELEEKVGTLNSTVARLEQKLGMIREGVLLSRKAVEALTEERQKHEAAMPGDKNSVLKSMERLHSLQAVYDVLRLRKNELDGMESKIAKQRLALKQQAQKALALDKDREKAGALFEQYRLELENAIGEMDRNAACMLSKNLKEGEPCPVCGSEHHPRPAAQAEGAELPVLERGVEDARKKLTEAEKVLKEAERAALVAGEQVKALTGQIDQAVQELALKTGEYIAEKQRLPEELRELELEQIRLELERMNGASAEKLRAVEAWEKKQEGYKERLQQLNDTLSEHRLSEKEILTELKVNRESLEQMEKSLSEAKRLFIEKKQRYREFLQQHKIDGAAAELKRLAENDRKINVLQEQMEQIQASMACKRSLLEQWKEELRALSSEDVKVQTEINNLSGQKSEKESKLKGLAQDANNIEDKIKRIDERLEEYVKLEKQYQERLQALEKQHNDLVTRKSLLANQQGIYSESLKAEEARLQAALQEKGFEDCSRVESSMLSPERQKALKDEIDEYDQAGVNIQAQKEMVQKKLNSRSITEEEWNRTSSDYLELTAFKEECVSRSQVAKSKFENLKSKHDRWVELNNSYKELKHKQELFEQIQKLLKAEHRKDNSFIDFIAEERLRYVAAKASQTLGVMTGYKYALELDADAGFIIRDNANGGVHRTVTSLSGGETFLTSLSLALALSEQIQLKGQSPLEFFFLDEGFGTLDNNLLDSVIDSLERLSRKERVIGLISHVPELRSRIGRRLIIDPPTSQGDGSRVKIEKA
ncbi:MAG: SbcC/MukB-like Walker B domain-containing protein [Clostridiales bacterium]|nr:AAA family ATPase [Eubacteriales bacterium]MDH7566390.1 SbcC/MukB-like Walker B domain-containing protein [Clostridiales bacterium]